MHLEYSVEDTQVPNLSPSIHLNAAVLDRSILTTLASAKIFFLNCRRLRLCSFVGFM